MDDTNRGPARSQRTPPRINSATSPNGQDEDGYDLSELTVADGFRPADAIPSRDFPLPSISYPTGRHDETPQRPSSIAKPHHHQHDSLRLRNDGSNSTGFLGGAQGDNRSSPSITPPARQLLGASLPNQLNSQRLSRSATDLGQQRRDMEWLEGPSRYEGPTNPTHPYSLYTQSTVPSDEPSGSHIQVGFTGLGDNYQRQIGLDGEESGGMVGPLGHTEELPPYSRYPQDVYSANTGVPTSSTSYSLPANESNNPRRMSSRNDVDFSGAGGIGMATRNPEFSSTEEDLNLARSGASIQSRSNASETHINGAAQQSTEKRPTHKWKRRAQKRMCGIVPYWAICLLVFAIILVAMIGVGVYESVVRKDDEYQGDNQLKYKPQPTSTEITPVLFLPPNFPALPTGSFALPPLDVSQAPKTCIDDPSQAQAWSCEMPYRYYQMEVERIPNASQTHNYNLKLTAINRTNTRFMWGTQPPTVLKPVALTLVNDPYEMGRGAAWWLQVKYNKTVIISADTFRTRLDDNHKRDDSGDYDALRYKKQSLGAQDGDTAWICTWPATTLEIFIYPKQNMSLALPTPKAPSSLGSTATATAQDAMATSPLTFVPRSPYPKVVKLLERRLSAIDPTASCKQVKILAGGNSSQDVLDDYGDPIEMTIIEDNSGSWTVDDDGYYRKRHAGRRRDYSTLRSRGLELTDCGCLWWSL